MRNVTGEGDLLKRLTPFLTVFLSGAATLTYEVVWQREMFHIFGASAPATAAILTAIFTGIAFGSRFSRWLHRRITNSVWVLLLLELSIGLWGAIAPVTLDLAESLYIATAHAVGEESSLLTLARFLLAIVPLLPATICMGATFPTMVNAFDQTGKRAVDWIYGLNMFGAVVGSLTTGLLWIPQLGQTQAAIVAVVTNAVIVTLLWRIRTTGDSKPVVELTDTIESGNSREQSIPALGWLYFAAGLVALGLEVVWLRFLGIVNTNSTVTFSLTLATYLAGMSFGSLFIYPFLRRWLSAPKVLGLANVGVAGAAVATYPVVHFAAQLNHSWIHVPAATNNLTVADLYRTESLIIVLLLILPTIFMGLVYPAVCDSVRGSRTSRENWIANAYFRGTLGSVAGILCISLFVIPAIGLHGTFAALVILSAALAAFTAMQSKGGFRAFLYSTSFLAGLGAAYIGWEARPVLHNTEVRRVGDRWMEYDFPVGSKPSTEIVRFRAGPSGTVIVKKEARQPDHLVYVDDQLVASTNIEAKVDSLMLAHLPLLLHPDPKSELTVGFGTGGTSHAITTHGIDAYCAEIEPQVPAAAHLLRDQNYGILENPRFNLILNDARDHLQITQRSYDVIATDVTNLQYKQNSSLYTVEYFELMKQRMNPGGVACAWIPMAAISTSELQTLMASFQDVFPHATLWFMNHTHTNFGILIGTEEALQVDYSRFEEGFQQPDVRASLQEIGVTEPMQLVHCLHLDEDGYRTFCGDAALHTDNRPVLEFSSPLSFYQYHETFIDNLNATIQLRPQAFQEYVVNGPEKDDLIWNQHFEASDAGCRVILALYVFQSYQRQGDREAAMNVLKQAIAEASRGMEAWPEDEAREQFYVQFFNEANQWAMSTMETGTSTKGP